MAERVDFLAEAWQEVVEAAERYEAEVGGVGDRLYAEVDLALDRIADAPDSGAPWTHRRVPRAVRRVPLRSFPYALFYLLEPRLLVVAFAHTRRRPGYWARRLDAR
jgi:toxin ParE1/3/4